MTKSYSRPSLYQRVWRWHFFAGLFVAPFAILLAITGAIYLFAPQLNAFSEADIHKRLEPASGERVRSPSVVLSDLLIQHSDYKLHRVRLAKKNDPTYEIDLKPKNRERDLPSKRIWINALSGEMVASHDPDSSVPEFVKHVHGELLTGDTGSLLVELVASWFIVLMVTGLYLYWPRGVPWHSVFFPSLNKRGRPLLLSLHGSIAAWATIFILLFLLSGLPWTQVWGGGFKWVQDQFGIPDQGQEFKVTLLSDSAAKGSGDNLNLDDVIERAQSESLKPPVYIVPPKPDGVWTVRSLHPNRAARVTIHYDQWTGEELMRIRFADKHWFKRLVSHGISLHEGHLFGPLNQALGLIVALCIIAISVTGPLMWWRRRPKAQLAAPVRAAKQAMSKVAVVSMLLLTAFLPLVAVSLVVILTLDLMSQKLRSVG